MSFLHICKKKPRSSKLLLAELDTLHGFNCFPMIVFQQSKKKKAQKGTFAFNPTN